MFPHYVNKVEKGTRYSIITYVNVMKHNHLFPTLISEFEYVVITIYKSIKNEDMNEQKMIFTSTIQ